MAIGEVELREAGEEDSPVAICLAVLGAVFADFAGFKSVLYGFYDGAGVEELGGPEVEKFSQTRSVCRYVVS